MPCGYVPSWEYKTWKTMKGWERKAFHRENQTRVARGMSPLPKPV